MAAAEQNLTIDLGLAELRAVTAFSVARAEPGSTRHAGSRPGGKRTKASRVTSLDAHRAARAARPRGSVGVSASAGESDPGLADSVVVDVLKRYPDAPGGGRRAGELLRTLDASLRSRSVL